MGSLSNLYISQSYQSLAHLGTNAALVPGTMTELQDGLGQSLNIYFDGTNISSSGNIYAANITGSGGGNIDSSSLVTTASFNAYTQSTNVRLNNLETTSASVNVSVNALNLFTASQSTASIVTSINNLNQFSASALTSISNLNASSASQQVSINALNSATSSYVTEAESGSFLITASFDNGTRNLTFTKGDASTFAVNIPDVSGSAGNFVTTSSFNAYTASNDQRVSSLEANSASVNISITNLNASSASQQVSIDALNTFTQSANIRLNNLESTSASVNTSISNINSATASLQSQLATIGTQSGSWITESETASFARYDVNNPWSAPQTFTSITASNALITYLTTVFETSSVIYSSGSNQFGDELTDVQILSGSVLIVGSGSINGQRILTTADTGSFTFNTGSLVTTASFNAYTQSNDQRVSSLEANSASVNTSITNINSFTQSAAISISALNAATSSYATSAITASSIITASAAGANITFTKGDASQFTITVATGSFLSASYAETSSITRNVVVVARNNNASTLGAGTVVHITSAVGDNPIFTTASYDNEALSSNTFGLLRYSSAPGADVEVVVNGVVTGVNTDPALGYTAGDILYLSSSGQFTKVQPQAPNQIVTLGQVLRAQQNNGSIYVSINNGWELNELHNVQINNPQTGDLIQYESSSYGLWKNKSIAGAGITTTSSFNAYTASTDNRLNSLETNSASVNISITNLNASSASQQISIDALNVFTASQSTASLVTSIDNLNQFSASALTSLSNLNQATSSLFGSASLALVTASFDNGTRNLTFTKGDTTTFSVNIPDVSGSSTINTGSFLTTGSVTGTQTVFGTLQFNVSESFAQNGIILFNTGSDASGSMELGVTGPGNPFIKLKKRTWFQIGPRDEIYYPEFTSSFDNGIYVGSYFSSGKVGLLATSGSLGLFAGNPTANRVLTNIQTPPSLANSSTNLVFVPNTGTTTTIVSGSNNIWVNPTNVTAGFNRYIGGSGNIYPNALPQLTGSAAFPVTMANNISNSGVFLRPPVSSSTYTISSNLLMNAAGTALALGTAAATNFERAQSGVNITNNIVAGAIQAVAAKTPLSSSSTISANYIGGNAVLNMDSSSINLNGTTIQAQLNINNSYFPSTYNATSAQISVNGSISIGSNTIYASGSNATFTAGRTISNIGMIGNANVISASLNGDNSNVASTMLFGQALNVIGSNSRQTGTTMPDYGSVFVGRWNAFDGNRGQTAETVFAVGTGTGTSTRKTGFLIDSGSNTFIEGTLNVSGSTTISGSLILSSSATTELIVVGNSEFTGAVSISGSVGAGNLLTITGGNVRSNGTISTSGLQLSGSATTEAINSNYENTLWQHAGNVTFGNQVAGVGSGSLNFIAANGGNLNISASSVNIDSDLYLDDEGGTTKFYINKNFDAEFLGNKTEWNEAANTLNITAAEETVELVYNGWGAGYDNGYIVNVGTNGTQFQDWNTSYVNQTWLKIPVNNNNNPAPIFTRGLEVTGSTNIAELTASLQNGYVWVGNASGRTTTVPTSSFGGGSTAGLATTGSNIFVGNQTITGSLILSSSAATELQVIGNSVFTGSVAGNVVSASITSNTASIDFNLGNYFEVTSSVTPLHLNITNITPGRTSTLIISASASSSITFSPNVAQPSGNAYSGSLGSIDILSLVAFNTSKVNLVATKALV